MSANANVTRRKPMWRAGKSIALMTLREAMRSRLLVVWLMLLLIVCGTQFFFGALSLMEGQVVALSIVAPISRLLAVLVTATFVIASVSREMSERGIEIVFSAPIPRHVWIIGRLAGFAVMGVGTAIFAALPLALNANVAAISLWGVSLAAELILVSAMALMIAIAIVRIPLALLAFLAAYVCSRMIGVIQMLQTSDPLEGDSTLTPSGWLIEGLAAILPRLDLLTRTDWLLGRLPVDGFLTLTPTLLQVPIFVALAIVIAAIDLRRRHV